MNHALIVLVLFTALRDACHAQESAIKGSHITKEAIVEGLRDIEEVVQAYEVNCSATNSIREVPFSRGEQYRVQRIDVRYKGDRTGRVRCEASSIETELPDGEVRSESFSAVFDGQLTRREYGRNDVSRPHGNVSAERHKSLLQGIDPFNFVVNFYMAGKSVADVLNDHNARIVDQLVRDGSEVVILETAPLPAKFGEQDIETLYHVELCPTKNFAVLKTAVHYRLLPTGGWVEYVSCHCDDFLQDSSGVWLPQSVVLEDRAMVLSADPMPPLLRKTQIRVNEWIINPDFPESTFSQLKFANRSLVKDEVAGRTYEVGEISDQMIADHAAEAQMQSDHVATDRTLSPVRLIIALLVLSTFVVIGIRALLQR